MAMSSCLLASLLFAYPLSEFGELDVACIVDTHPLTVRTTDASIYVLPWRSNLWRRLDVDEYDAC